MAPASPLLLAQGPLRDGAVAMRRFPSVVNRSQVPSSRRRTAGSRIVPVHRPEQMGSGTATVVVASASREMMAVGRRFMLDVLGPIVFVEVVFHGRSSRVSSVELTMYMVFVIRVRPYMVNNLAPVIRVPLFY